MIRCQKCASLSTVHLTEVVKLADGTRQPKEIHLCLAHAVEAGLIAPPQPLPPSHANVTPIAGPVVAGEAEMGQAIVPVEPGNKDMVVARKEATDPATCPICGMTWHQFRQSGVMGCPHDYQQYEGKLLPLLKRAQEGSTQHAGKIPVPLRDTQPAIEATTMRLRRELDKALASEDYERAAKLRDELRKLGSN